MHNSLQIMSIVGARIQISPDFMCGHKFIQGQTNPKSVHHNNGFIGSEGALDLPAVEMGHNPSCL